MESSDAQADSTFLFADIAGFTALTEAHGDHEAAELASTFAGDVRGHLGAHGAELVKTIGDALMIRAGDPAEAIRLGLLITHDLGRAHGAPQIRVGMHRGAAVRRDDDWFGATVNVAARISGLAGGGEVLLSDEVRSAAGDLEGIAFRALGPHRLRNVAEPVVLFAALPAGARQADLAIDPVCRMAVDPDRCAGTLVHDGVEYHFCSLDCAARFASDPESYASPV